jgi:YHS domain-containing protein
MFRVILLLILVVLVARTFWRVIDGLIEGISGRGATNVAGRSTKLVRDPVCGTWVLPKDEMSLTDGRERVFFCSAACRDHYRSRTA